MSSLGDRIARAKAAAGDEVAPQTEGTDAAAAVVTATGATPVRATGRHKPDAPSAGPLDDLAAGRRAVGANAEVDASVSRRLANAASAQQDRLEDVKGNVHAELLKQLGPQLYDSNLDQADLESRVRQVLKDVLSAQERPLSNADRTKVTLEITDDILGYGPIEPFLRDPEITEVMVNGPDSIFVERHGRIEHVNARFTDEVHLRRTIDKIVSRIGRRVDASSPLVDASLPEGSRVKPVLPPLAIAGTAMTIRTF